MLTVDDIGALMQCDWGGKRHQARYTLLDEIYTRHAFSFSHTVRKQRRWHYTTTHDKRWIKEGMIFKKYLQKRALVIALVVGTMLNCINQGPEVLDGGSLNWFKLVLTYIVPYFVSVYSAVASNDK